MQGHCVSRTINLGDQGSQNIRTGGYTSFRDGPSLHLKIYLDRIIRRLLWRFLSSFSFPLQFPIFSDKPCWVFIQIKNNCEIPLFSSSLFSQPFYVSIHMFLHFAHIALYVLGIYNYSFLFIYTQCSYFKVTFAPAWNELKLLWMVLNRSRLKSNQIYLWIFWGFICLEKSVTVFIPFASSVWKEKNVYQSDHLANL